MWKKHSSKQRASIMSCPLLFSFQKKKNSYCLCPCPPIPSLCLSGYLCFNVVYSEDRPVMIYVLETCMYVCMCGGGVIGFAEVCSWISRGKYPGISATFMRVFISSQFQPCCLYTWAASPMQLPLVACWETQQTITR